MKLFYIYKITKLFGFAILEEKVGEIRSVSLEMAQAITKEGLIIKEIEK